MGQLNYRHELKYLCNEPELFILEQKTRSICLCDPYTNQDGMYTIRSLYFDTYDDLGYQENKMGSDGRKKYRIRIYNGNSDKIKLECKYSLHGLKAKESCYITKQQCENLITLRPITGVMPEQELLRRFVVEQKMLFYVPKIIVEYVRSPYIYNIENTRITFDRAIRACKKFETFFEANIAGRTILTENINVLEVKYDKYLPATIMDMVAYGQQLQRTSFSKYMLCRDYS